ncbi:hypothetical protein fugu_001847 [Takifugu bimaculatus]|uniref:C-type lectin domain-containing protein n=1 Tax=Takifugu bimaculatus TaxID=433685 RepID=A0A4Z2BMY7_9TELE|nr:hypothetical protein fugu_001847 [Takifugu bimaculatus]
MEHAYLRGKKKETREKDHNQLILGESSYYLINSSKTWLEAQQHCRRAQGDLASVSDLQDLKELAGLLKDNSRVAFLGLRREWGWSVSDGDDYREGEPVYWNWADNEPSQQDCVSVGLSGKWFATNCSTTLNFFCYNGKLMLFAASTTGISPRFILIEGSLNWSDAQAYCRRRYTNLAWVRHKHENKELWDISNNLTVWIGLTRMSWRWSDGSQPTFLPWKMIPHPHEEHGDCGALDVHDKIHGIIHLNCAGKAPFFCSRGKRPHQFSHVKTLKSIFTTFEG